MKFNGGNLFICFTASLIFLILKYQFFPETSHMVNVAYGFFLGFFFPPFGPTND